MTIFKDIVDTKKKYLNIAENFAGSELLSVSDYLEIIIDSQLDLVADYYLFSEDEEGNLYYDFGDSHGIAQIAAPKTPF